MALNKENIFKPFRASVKEAIDSRCDTKLFKILPERKVDYTPGKFFMVSKWGAGEIPISVTSTQGFQKYIELAIKKVGTVTRALHTVQAGDTIWLRGPYGNGFSTDVAKKKDVVFIAGGIGIVPLRSLINLVLMHKKKYKKIFLLYGAKNPFEILFEQDIKAWGKKGMEVILTVDEKDKRWKGRVGLVTEHLDRIKTDFKKACAYICGPEIMIEKTMRELSSRDMPDKRIVTTLESRMKCGIGKCGQCYRGTEYICTNGPVYTYEEITNRKVYGP